GRGRRTGGFAGSPNRPPETVGRGYCCRRRNIVGAPSPLVIHPSFYQVPDHLNGYHKATTPHERFVLLSLDNLQAALDFKEFFLVIILSVDQSRDSVVLISIQTQPDCTDVFLDLPEVFCD